MARPDWRSVSDAIFRTRRGRIGYVLVAAFIVVVVFYNSAYVYVGPNQFAIKQVTIGPGKGIKPDVLYAGLHWVTPGTERLHLFPTDVQVLSLTNDPKERLAKLMNLAISNVAVSYKDSGLFSKFLAYFAKQQSKSVDDLKTEWTMLATQMIPVLLGGDPSSLKLAEAVGKFIAAPKSLTLSATAKGEPPKVADFARMTDPKALLSRVDIGASAGQ